MFSKGANSGHSGALGTTRLPRLHTRAALPTRGRTGLEISSHNPTVGARVGCLRCCRRVRRVGAFGACQGAPPWQEARQASRKEAPPQSSPQVSDAADVANRQRRERSAARVRHAPGQGLRRPQPRSHGTPRKPGEHLVPAAVAAREAVRLYHEGEAERTASRAAPLAWQASPQERQEALTESYPLSGG